MNNHLFRDRILKRLMEDLVGPLAPSEILADRPTQRYSTGILYPRESYIGPEEDQDGGQAVNEVEDAASLPEDAGVSLHASLKPSAAGLSFAVAPSHRDNLLLKVCIDCAVYQRVTVDDAGEEVEGSPPDRAHERWRRRPIKVELSVELRPGVSRVDLGAYGVPGMELYVLATPASGVITVTAALANHRVRGDSSAYDEEQHFFQVQLSIVGVSGGMFAPRPSRRAQTDEDSRIAALIYRDVQEYVVGHVRRQIN